MGWGCGQGADSDTPVPVPGPRAPGPSLVWGRGRDPGPRFVSPSRLEVPSRGREAPYLPEIPNGKYPMFAGKKSPRCRLVVFDCGGFGGVSYFVSDHSMDELSAAIVIHHGSRRIQVRFTQLPVR